MRIPISDILRTQRVIVAANGTPVTLLWTELVGGTWDPVSGVWVGGTSTVRRETVRALVHFSEGRTMERRWAELEVGDVVVDFAPEAPLDGKPGLRFAIQGREYVSKEVPDKLAAMWDATVMGVKLTRTVVLQLAG